MGEGLAMGDGLSLFMDDVDGEQLGAGIPLLLNWDSSLLVMGTGSDGSWIHVGSGVPVLLIKGPVPDWMCCWAPAWGNWENCPPGVEEIWRTCFPAIAFGWLLVVPLVQGIRIVFTILVFEPPDGCKIRTFWTFGFVFNDGGGGRGRWKSSGNWFAATGWSGSAGIGSLCRTINVELPLDGDFRTEGIVPCWRWTIIGPVPCATCGEPGCCWTSIVLPGDGVALEWHIFGDAAGDGLPDEGCEVDITEADNCAELRGTCGNASVVGKGVFSDGVWIAMGVADIGCFSTLNTAGWPCWLTMLSWLPLGLGDCWELVIFSVNCILCPWGKSICCCIIPGRPPFADDPGPIDADWIVVFGTKQRVIKVPGVCCCCCCRGSIRVGGGLPVGHRFNTICPMLPPKVDLFAASCT